MNVWWGYLYINGLRLLYMQNRQQRNKSWINLAMSHHHGHMSLSKCLFSLHVQVAKGMQVGVLLGNISETL
jgi:hypothetical protein